MGKPRETRGRLLAGLLIWFAAVMPAAAADAVEPAVGNERSDWFDAFFLQRGVGEEVESLTLGLIRQLPVSWLGERGGLYGELSLSHWEARPRAPRDTGTLVQLGLKPVLRYTLIEGSVPTFVELGIGLTMTSEVYRKSDRQFSTTFNFGDHLAIGWAFGNRRQHELVLRAEHFSNAEIREPNPGENFRQLRYVYWF